MSSESIDYQRMVQDALLDVVRESLRLAAEHGLPGAHHFYIAFATGVPGVVLSDDLRRKYPDHVTVVLQHDYRDLEVFDDRFVVTLRFGGIPQRITVPYSAMVSFYDPSVQFALRFEPTRPTAPSETEAATGAHDEDGRPRRPPVRAVLAAADRLAAAKEAQEEEERRREAEALPKIPSVAARNDAPGSEAAPVDEDGDGDDEEPRGAEIVSFDAFRRK